MEKIYGFVHIAIDAGHADDFRAGAAACHAAALPDLTGTELYEWFVSDDGREAWVIEVYDDPAAVAHHGKMMHGRSARLREFAQFDIIFGGHLRPGMLEAFRERLGTVCRFGRLVHGLLTEPVAHRDPAGPAEQVCALAWFTPRPGQATRLRALASETFARARDGDPGTLAYEWFFDDAGRALVLDVYRDGAAMLAHMRNCGPIMGEIVKIADSRTILFGEVPAAIEDRLRPELGITRVRRRLHGVF